MWSSVTDRRIGTAGVSFQRAEGSSDGGGAQRVEDRLDAEAAPTSLLPTVRRDDLCGQGEKLAAIDALVVPHACPMRASPPTRR